MGYRFPRPTAITHAWCACEIRGRITLRRDGDIAPYRHYAREIRPWRLAIAPYRHYARMVRTRITCAHYTRTPSEALNRLRRGTCEKRRFASARFHGKKKNRVGLKYGILRVP